MQSFSALERRIETGKKLLALIGTEACPLEVEAWVNGSPLEDSDLKGKVVLLDFWAVWCGPCIAEFPALKEIRSKYAEKDIEFIFVNADKDPTKFATALEKYKLSFGFHLPRNERIMDDYYVSFIPRLFLISPEGLILYSRHEEKDHESLKHLNIFLKQLLGEGS